LTITKEIPMSLGRCLSLCLVSATLALGAACESSWSAKDSSNIVTTYQGCPFNSTDYTCSDGTTCQASLLTAEASGAWCSRPCTGTMDMCPREAGGRTVGCFQPMGASGAQCYATCPSASSTCPQGTKCASLMSATGTSLRLCVPQA
jgi:hypothetical protein